MWSAIKSQFEDKRGGFRLIIFTVITTILFLTLSCLAPNGRIYQHRQQQAAQAQQMLQTTRKQLPVLREQVLQLQKRKDVLDKRAGNVLVWPEELIPPRRDIADACDQIQDRINALDDAVTGVTNLKSRFEAISDWASR